MEVAHEKCSSIEALLKRKTHRKFQNSSLSFIVFSTMLRNLNNELFKGVWHYYVAIFDVEHIPAGVYRYCPINHSLIGIKKGLFRNDLVTFLCGMSASLTASFLIIFSLDLKTAQQKFTYNRALREFYIESGRLAQKIILKGMQYNIGGLPSPAMRDSQICKFLEIYPNQCIPIYSLTMGMIAEAKVVDTGHL
jgi:SagB-type dehydrogenase family enzyme